MVITDSDSVLLINHAPEPFRGMYAGKQCVIRPGKDNGQIVPWPAAKLWLGDPTLIDTDWERPRSDELFRIKFRYGIGDQPFRADTPIQVSLGLNDTKQLPPRNYVPCADPRHAGKYRHPDIPEIEVRFTDGTGWQTIDMLIDEPEENPLESLESPALSEYEMLKRRIAQLEAAITPDERAVFAEAENAEDDADISL